MFTFKRLHLRNFYIKLILNLQRNDILITTFINCTVIFNSYTEYERAAAYITSNLKEDTWEKG